MITELDLLRAAQGLSMKRFAIAVLLLAISGQVAASSAVTKNGYVACLSKVWLDDFVTFAVADDTASIRAYIESKKCIPPKAGIRVTITESAGMFGTKTGFALKTGVRV